MMPILTVSSRVAMGLRETLAKGWNRSLSRIRRISGYRIFGDTPQDHEKSISDPQIDFSSEMPQDQIPAKHILVFEDCPICGSKARTMVNPFNKFVLFDQQPDTRSSRYHYALCHECGVVSATRRPGGPRYRWLLEHFEESLGRATFGTRRTGKFSLSSYKLTDDMEAKLTRLASHGVFVSDHLGVGRKEYLPSLLADRFSNSVHIELIRSLLSLKTPRVLEIRSRLGSIVGSLKQTDGAEVYAMALFDNQKFLIKQVYDIPTELIDFERFHIPFPPPFDLIIANHMLTHAIRPSDFLATVHKNLSPGGHIYLYNEPDDAEILDEGKSMFNTLNPFHLQAFDEEALVRALAANSFQVKFITRHAGSFLCLAQAVEQTDSWTRMPANRSSRRRGGYRRAYDASVIMTSGRAKERFSTVWDAVVERAIANGFAEKDTSGRVRLIRSGRTGHHWGYAKPKIKS